MLGTSLTGSIRCAPPLPLLALLLLAGPAWASTVLHLSDTESVSVPPDMLVATLRAEASASTATAAQQQVNAAIAAAVIRIHQVAAVKAQTQGYTAWQPKQQGAWQASQSIRLSATDGPPLLALVGQLQQAGLAISDLEWQLSPAAFRAAQDQASSEALGRLRQKADAAAKTLGLRFESFQRVDLAGPEFAPVPRMMAMAAAAPTPPTAIAQDVPVTATVTADVVLVPASAIARNREYFVPRWRGRRYDSSPGFRSCGMALSNLRPEVEGFHDKDTGTVTYVVSDPASGMAAVIDPVLDYDPKSGRTSTRAADAVIARVQERGLKIDWLLETHVHADHLSGLAYVKRRLGGRSAIGAQINEVQGAFKDLFGFERAFQPDGSQFDHLFADGETVPGRRDRRTRACTRRGTRPPASPT